MEAKIITVEGIETVVTPKNGTHFELKELQDIVGGWIEAVYFDAENVMIVNEEGKLMGLPFNLKATQLFRIETKLADFIVGNVLITPRKFMK